MKMEGKEVIYEAEGWVEIAIAYSKQARQYIELREQEFEDDCALVNSLWYGV